MVLSSMSIMQNNILKRSNNARNYISVNNVNKNIVYSVTKKNMEEEEEESQQ